MRCRAELAAGTPIVVLEPSCASVFRDEAPALMPDDPRAARLKTQTMLLGEFLVKHAPDYKPAQLQRRILVHAHCHQRAIFNVKDELAMLGATGGEVKLLDAGCCGMAGPFGFEKKSYGVSQILGERALLPAVRRGGARHRDRDRWIQLPRAGRTKHRPARGACCGSVGGRI